MVYTFVVIETFIRLHYFIPNVYLLFLSSIIVTIVSDWVINHQANTCTQEMGYLIFSQW